MGKRGPEPGGKLTVINPRPPKRPEPPRDMSKRAKATWRAIVRSLPAEHFPAGSLPLLRAYCEAEEVHHKATKIIDRAGPIIKSENPNYPTIKANPAVAIQTAKSGEMAQLSTKLKLNVNSYRDREKKPAAKPKGQARRTLYGG